VDDSERRLPPTRASGIVDHLNCHGVWSVININRNASDAAARRV
jgi:hypothetical protein